MPRSESVAHRRIAALIAVLSVTMLLAGPAILAVSDPPPHFLDYSEDNYKIVFISGNFTAKVTRVKPMVVFEHTNPVLSPTFGVSSAKLYVFNDSNHDGIFSRSEAIYVSYLDAQHVTWNASGIEFGNDSAGGEYAQVRMSTNASLYATSEDVSVMPRISNWAGVTFGYRISERTTNYTNALGTYEIRGRTEMRVDLTISMLKHVNATGVALEVYISGGGSTNMMVLRQGTSSGGSKLTNVSSRIDETAIGANFTHRFIQTSKPTQDVYIAKEDGVPQAFYHFGSAPMNGSGENASVIQMNPSYYTDGAGLFLHQAFFTANGTKTIVQESSLGIDELGFVVDVRGWLQSHLALLMAVCGVIASVVLIALLAVMYRRYRRSRSGDGIGLSKEGKLD